MQPTPETVPVQMPDVMTEQAQIEFGGVRDMNSLLAVMNQERRNRRARRIAELAERERRGQDPTLDSRVVDGDTAQEAMRRNMADVKQIMTVLQSYPESLPPENTIGGKVARAIIRNVPIEDINDRSASYLSAILRKALSPGGITNPLATLTGDELSYLKNNYPPVAVRVVESLVEAAEGTVDTNRINQFRQEHIPQGGHSQEATEYASTEQERAANSEVKTAVRTDLRRKFIAQDMYLPQRYFQRDDQVEVMWALQSAEHFVQFIKEELSGESAETPAKKAHHLALKERLNREDPSGRKWQEHVTEEIEKKVLGVFDEFFVALDEAKPTEFFDHIAREDYQQGFGVLLTRTRNLFRTLPNYINQSTDPKVVQFRDDGEFNFWVHDLEHTDEARQYKPGKNGQTLHHVVQKYSNHPPKKGVGIEDFLRHIGTLINSEDEVRQFTHNAKALFYHPVGKEGFYGRLSEFSSKMLTGDIDEFLRLPDNDLFMTAYNLYSKFLEADFAKYDWRHPPGMFELVNGFNTQMESDVLDMLKVIYANENIPEWRLRRALSLGVGASLGIFQTEVETASYADPNLKADGTDSYADYYRNGVAALKPFAPFAHGPWRFQKENLNMADLLFLPVKSISKRLWKNWDHTKVFEEMNKYKKSYLERSYDPVDDGTIRLIEMMNFAKAGGPISRATWRMEEGSLDHLYVYKPMENTGGTSSELNYLETWKSIENVGFEVLFNYERLLSKIFVDPAKNMEDRRELFRYLYTSYIAPGASEGDFSSYFNSLEAAAGRKEYLNQRDDMKPPWRIQEVYRLEVNRALAGILKRRIPTKFLRMERGRFTKGGKNARLWDSIKREMGLPDTDRGVEEFDGIVKDLATVESLHRNEISKQMEHWMEHHEDKRLNNMPVDYQLTAEKVGDLLDKALRRDGENNDQKNARIARVASAKRLFEHLDRKEDRTYLDQFAYKLQERYAQTGSTSHGWTEMPYAIAPEEFDMRFFNWRGGGPGVLKRLNDESARVETEVVTLLTELPHLLNQVATNGKQDFTEIVDALDKMKDSMSRMHGGVAYPTEMANHLAAVVISYFKKDTIARNIFTKAFTIGTPSSMAAEFAGTWRNVWEWDVADIHKFINALEARRIVPKTPTELMTVKVEPGEEKSIMGIKYRMGRKVIRPDMYQYSGKQLRKDFGATGKHIALEVANKYLPLLGVAVLFAAVSDGIEEALEDVKDSRKR